MSRHIVWLMAGLLTVGRTITLQAAEVTWDGSDNMTWTQPDATSWSGNTYESGDTATFVGAGQGTVTLSGTITPSNVTVSAGAYTFAGTAIGGDGGLTVSGGTLILNNAANTYSSNTVVGADGTLQIKKHNCLPFGVGKGNVTVDGALAMQAVNLTVNGLTGAGNVVHSGNGWSSQTLILGDADASSTFDGVIQSTVGTLHVTKTDAGTVALGGNNAYSGVTTVNGGTLAMSGSNTLSGAATVTVNAGTLAMSGNNSFGAGTRTVDGGTLRLSGTNTGTGTLTVNTGTLEIAGEGTFGSGRTVIAGGATLDVSGRNSALEIAAGETLAFRGLGATATLVTAAGKGVTPVGAAALHFDDYDGVTPLLSVSGGGALTLQSDNDVTVTVSGTTPLSVGDYTLVSGGVAGVAPTSYVTVNGTGRAAATTATLVIDGGDLILRIADYSPVHAPTSIETAAAGPWDSPDTWQGGIVPGPNDSVTLNHAVTLLCGTHPLASFSNNATLTFNGWNASLNADTITINATVTHLAQTATAPDPVTGEWIPDNRVLIVGGNLTLNSNKSIDVDVMGYDGLCGPSWDGASRYGGNGCTYFGGAYGGEQGYTRSGEIAPHTYGSMTAPLDPGSGGGKTEAGGGAIRIDLTGDLIVNGNITANGNGAYHWNGGGSSGGGIYITCNSVSGTGDVTANGGSKAVYGGGGGGRVAVHYDAEAQASAVCSVRFEARGGLSVSITEFPGSPGSLYFTDNQLFTSSAYLTGGWKFAGALYSGVGLTSLDVNESLLLDQAWVVFPEPGFTLNVAGDLTITGLYSHVYGLFLGTNGHASVSGDISLQCARLQMNSGGSLNVDGDFTQIGSDFCVYAAPTNSPGQEGATVDIGGTWLIDTESVCYPYCEPTNGATALFQVGDLTVASNGLIDATSKGYPTRLGPGTSLVKTIGPSHGGRGGNNPGGIYGVSNAPVCPGSGGTSGWGGGVVRITAVNSIVVDGSIFADGGASQNTWESGGSGGSIYLTCNRFAGETGQIRAAGGVGESSEIVGRGAAGGGGRIAIWRKKHEASVALTTNVTAPGAWGGNTSSEAGTVFWGWILPAGTLITIM